MSSSQRACTGMPVQRLTISLTSSAVTSSRSIRGASGYDTWAAQDEAQYAARRNCFLANIALSKDESAGASATDVITTCSKRH